jgi:TetR/AcrR family transcriptional regulator, fatty acid metabolism regulator protein
MDRREQIRRGAIEVIARKGFHAATTQMIAREADVAVGTIYNYFRSKDEILNHIIEVECERRSGFLRRMIETSWPARKKLRAFLEMHFDQIRENPALARLMLQECRFAGREDPDPIRDRYMEMPRLLGEMLSPGGDREESRILGTTVFGAVQAFSLQFLLTPQTPEVELDQAVDHLVDLFAGR